MATSLSPQVYALTVIVALFSAHFIHPCDANAFRGQSIKVATGSVNLLDIQTSLWNWTQGGADSNGEGRLSLENLVLLEDQFRPTFVALPKNMHGNLGHAAVRYALHRFFVQTYGMYVKGLEPDGEAWNKSALPTDVIKEHVPTYVHAIFENLFGEEGFNQNSLAVLAGTLEHFIHEEQIQSLDIAFRANGLDRSGNDEAVASEEQISEVIDTYMQIFLLGKNETSLKGADILTQRKEIAVAYPNWAETHQFLERVRTSVLGIVPGSSKKFSFTEASHVVQEVGKEYGSFQNSECQDLKKALVGIEDQGSGRVKIQDFYSGALGGKWQFSESVAYLRLVGALDESDPSQLRVFIPNYLNSPSNCLVSSSLYSICCINECEGLLSHFEKRIAGPDATPVEILRLAAELGTPAAEAVSESLQQRLEEISRQNEGRVPLHGRLFAQWMHHAFPRECAYPHRAGTTRPMTANEWMQETGLSHKASAKEMLRHISVSEDGELFEEVDDDSVIDSEAVGGSESEAGAETGEVVETRFQNPSSGVMCPPSPWEPEEELLIWGPEPPSVKPRHPFLDALGTLVLVAAIVAMGLNANQIVSATLLSVRGGQGSAKKF